MKIDSRRHLAVLAVFCLLTLVMTFPAPFRAAGHISDLYDGLLNTWILSWDVHKITTGLGGFFNGNFYYPHENTLAYSEHLLGAAFFAAPIAILTKNPVLTHNIIQLSSFVLTGFFMYILAYYLTGDLLASMIAGIIFAFTPYRFTHFSQVQLVIMQWIPLVFLFLHRFFKTLSYKDLFLFTIFFLLEFLSCGYYALFLTVFAGLFIVISIVYGKLYSRPDVWLKLAVFAVISAAVILPLFYPYIITKKTMGFTRSYEEAYKLSADILSYVSAPSTNKIWKPLNPYLDGEQNLFLGYVTVILGGLGIFSLFRNCGEKKADGRPSKKEAILFYLPIFVLAALFSFGPVIRFLHKDLVTGPYMFLYKYVPGFDGLRVPARFGVFAIFPLAIFAAFAVKSLFKRIKGPSGRYVLTAVLGAFILAEYFAGPIRVFPVETGRDIPAVYNWLSGTKGDFGVIELPVGEPVIPADARYMYYSAYHWKRLVNGYSGYAPPAYYAVKEAVKYFPDDTSKGMLEDIGVKYVIIHGGLLGKERLEGIRDKSDADSGLRFIVRFGEDYVYELLPSTQKNDIIPGGDLKEIPNRNWSVKASISGDRAGLAIDGNRDSASRWWTGRPQKKGDFFELDMGGVYNVAGIKMTLGYILDPPVGYRVETSLNGYKWDLAREDGAPRVPIMAFIKNPTDVSFDIFFEPRRARIVRITQTGEDKVRWWGIAELKVFEKH